MSKPTLKYKPPPGQKGHWDTDSYGLPMWLVKSGQYGGDAPGRSTITQGGGLDPVTVAQEKSQHAKRVKARLALAERFTDNLKRKNRTNKDPAVQAYIKYAERRVQAWRGGGDVANTSPELKAPPEGFEMPKKIPTPDGPKLKRMTDA